MNIDDLMFQAQLAKLEELSEEEKAKFLIVSSRKAWYKEEFTDLKSEETDTNDHLINELTYSQEEYFMIFEIILNDSMAYAIGTTKLGYFHLVNKLHLNYKNARKLSDLSSKRSIYSREVLLNKFFTSTP
eukprot:36491_1